MKNLRNKNQPAPTDTIQYYLSSSWDKVLAVYAKLADIEIVSDAITAGDLDGILQETDLDTLAELNALVTDATFGDFASQAQAEAGADNTTTMTPLRVAQAIAVLAAGIQNNFTAIVDPVVTDDTNAGYVAGSVWINTAATPPESWRCADPSAGAAVWVKTTLTVDELAAVATSGDSDDLTEGVAKLLLTVGERSKLGAIEIGATADQTDTEIETAYNNRVATVLQAEAEAGTSTTVRRWTPERVKQSVIALAPVSSYLPLAGGTMTGDILVTGAGVEIGQPADRFWNVYAQNGYYSNYLYIGTDSSDWMTIQKNTISGGKSNNFTFSIDNKTADEAVVDFIIQGQVAHANATVNLIGGDIDMRGGSGSLNTAGLGHGGQVYLDGGLPHGTGVAGDVHVGNTRGNLKVYNQLVMLENTVGALPAAATAAGYITAVSDSLAPVNGSTVAAGGAVSCVVYSDGTNWIVVTGGTTAGGDVATDAIWDAAGDLAVGSGANTAAKLTMGTALQVLRVNAGATALEYATVASGGGLVVEFKTASFTAVAGKKYKVDSTAAPVVVTLPVGNNLDNIVIQDVGSFAGSNNITINPNGAETIKGTTTFVIDQDEGDVDIGYNSGTTDWQVSADGSPNVVNVNDFATGFAGVNAQTGTTYEFVELDLVELVTANNGSASAYTIADSFAAVGETLNLLNIGAGLVTITVPGADTLASSDNTCPQGDAITIIKITSSSWWVVGGTAP